MERQRGIVLTATGNQHMRAALRGLVQSEKIQKTSQAEIVRYVSSQGYTLDRGTISSILKARGVDPASLEDLFSAIGLTLEESDWNYPAEDPPLPIDSGADSGVSSQTNPTNIPFLGTTTFVGRRQTLEELQELLNRETTQVTPVALSGMGGVGKTEIGIQYGQRFSNSYSGGVCWIFARRLDAPSNASIASQITAFVQLQLEITIPDHLTSGLDRVNWCWNHWPPGNVLIIFDDVDHYSDIAPDYLPKDPRFKILLTTRLRLGSPVQLFSLDVLEREDSLELLDLLVDDDRINDHHNANALCDLLGDLPLGVELVGQYLANDPHLTIEELLRSLQERARRRQLPNYIPFQGDHQENPAWTLTARRGLEAAFDLTWERLNRDTQLIAKLIGRFEPGAIRWETVEIMREMLAEDVPQYGEVSPDILAQSRSRLLLFNLLKPFNERNYRLHPLTREFFRSKTTDEEEEQYAASF